MPELYDKGCVSQKVMIEGVHSNVTKHDSGGEDLKISINSKAYF